MLSIGEFSRVTGLTIKALRLYHKKGILVPDRIETGSKYRYYHRSAVEKAFVIKKLKDMGFSLQEIGQIVRECRDDEQILQHVQTKFREVESRILEFQKQKARLSEFLEQTGSTIMGYPEQNHIQRETVKDQTICGIRFKGRYSESGERIGRLFKICGRHALGHPFSIYYDGEYKEENADIESCLGVRQEIVKPDTGGTGQFSCRELKGGEAVTLIHRGPYSELGRSYMRIFEYCREYGLKTQLPIREEYIKGPGMILKGNRKKYITKLILMVDG